MKKTFRIINPIICFLGVLFLILTAVGVFTQHWEFVKTCLSFGQWYVGVLFVNLVLSILEESK